MDDILPCPYCRGGKPALYSEVLGDIEFFQVGCTCGASASKLVSLTLAVRYWNRVSGGMNYLTSILNIITPPRRPCPPSEN